MHGPVHGCQACNAFFRISLWSLASGVPAMMSHDVSEAGCDGACHAAADSCG